jgi:hypothetical protein
MTSFIRFAAFPSLITAHRLPEQSKLLVIPIPEIRGVRFTVLLLASEATAFSRQAIRSVRLDRVSELLSCHITIWVGFSLTDKLKLHKDAIWFRDFH